MMNIQTAVHRTYRSLADVVIAVTLLMTRWRRLVEVEDDEDGGRQHRQTWMEDDL
jgi:hypothetical protein